MKLASFDVQTKTGPIARIGVKDGPSLLDITAGYAAMLERDGRANPQEKAGNLVPPTLIDFLANGEEAMDAATAVAEADFEDDERSPAGSRIRYARDEVSLTSPIRKPNSVRDCIAFEEHIRNANDEDPPEEWYDLPVYYKSTRDNIYGPGQDIHWPSYSEEADYELEIAAVVGKRGKDISARRALDYIAGFTIFNDFSARDIQMEEMAVGLGPSKGKDFANAFGPYLVTTDDIDLSDLPMKADINGERWSDGNVNTMYHSFERIIEHVSMGETIYPGDVIGSGTVGGGCGLELGRELDDGDTVTLHVEGIGTLENTVRF